MKWQPIETAPKDGTSILVCIARLLDSHKVVFWNEEAVADEHGLFSWEIEDTDTAYHENAFTHWMPLPDPPEDSL